VKKENQARILYFIQLPPPVHGVSVINEIVFSSKSINPFSEKKLVRINFSSDVESLRKFTLRKLWIFFETIFKLKMALLRFRPDVVYFSLIPVGSGFIRDSVFAMIIKVFNRKVIFHLNNRGISEYNIRPLYKRLYKMVFNNSTIIHVSKGLLQTEIEPLKLKNAHLFVVGNTIESFNILKENNEQRIIRILFLSNYFPQKGLMILLQAMDLMIKKRLAVKLDAYGAKQDKNEEQRCNEFILENNLKNHVDLHGPIFGKEKYKAFERADIFVFPSYFEEECFPLSILEAMNAKLPIIATRIGAIPEMIEDNLEGLIVEPKRPDLIFEKLKYLIYNKDLRKKLGNNAYNKFKINYSLPVFEEKMNYVFKSVLANPKS